MNRAVIDLSHPLTSGMPVYPGTPPVEIDVPFSIERDGFRQRRLTICTHAGTHLDAPAHILSSGSTLDDLPLGRFVGPGLALDLTGLGRPFIEISDLAPAAGRPLSGGFLLLRTGWSKLWGRPEYFEGYPVLSLEAAAWLADRGLSGLGVDAPSIDPYGPAPFRVHETLLGRGLVVVENLTNLESLVGRRFLFVGLPLRLAGGDGSPIRAAAIVEDNLEDGR